MDGHCKGKLDPVAATEAFGARVRGVTRGRRAITALSISAQTAVSAPSGGAACDQSLLLPSSCPFPQVPYIPLVGHIMTSIPSPTLITIPFPAHHIRAFLSKTNAQLLHYVEGPYYTGAFTTYWRRSRRHHPLDSSGGRLLILLRMW